MARLRITYNAPVVLSFAAASIVATLMPHVVVDTWFTAQPQLDGPSSYVGLFTYILGHGGWDHLIKNFMFILLVGPILEERHGSLKLAVMILVTALIGSLANLAFSNHPMLGASGVAFMMILLASMANVRAGEIPLTMIIIAIVFMSGELVAAIQAKDNIAHGAHLIGGVTGAGFGFLTARLKKTPAKPAPVVVTAAPVKKAPA